MGVVTVDDVVPEPVGEERRLPVVFDLPDGLHVPVPVLLALDQLHRDPAVGGVADVAVVQRVEVRNVEEVLDQQQVVGRHLHRTGADRLVCVVGDLGSPRWLRFVPALRIPRPDPHHAVALDHGEGPELRVLGDGAVGMGRHRHASALRVVAQAVVGAFEGAVVEHPALGERHALVCAPVVEGTDRTVSRAPEQNRTPRDRVSLQLVDRELLGESGDVPGIADVVAGNHVLCLQACQGVAARSPSGIAPEFTSCPSVVQRACSDSSRESRRLPGDSPPAMGAALAVGWSTVTAASPTVMTVIAIATIAVASTHVFRMKPRRCPASMGFISLPSPRETGARRAPATQAATGAPRR